jgi:hypothetical protein
VDPDLGALCQTIVCAFGNFLRIVLGTVTDAKQRPRLSTRFTY